VPLLLVLAVLAALLVALNSGPSPRSHGSSANGSGKSARVRHRHSPKAPAASATPTAGTQASTGAVAPAEADATRSSAAASETPPGDASRGAGPAAVPDPGPAGEAGSPTAAVEAFYGAAARHEYATAWGLADTNMRDEVAGYGSFSAQQSAVRSITFHRAEMLPGATASQATVAVSTTSVTVDRTEQCSGTVRTVREAAGWVLDGISIDCTP
jgi:hypothetical protein